MRHFFFAAAFLLLLFHVSSSTTVIPLYLASNTGPVTINFDVNWMPDSNGNVYQSQLSYKLCLIHPSATAAEIYIKPILFMKFLLHNKEIGVKYDKIHPLPEFPDAYGCKQGVLVIHTPFISTATKDDIAVEFLQGREKEPIRTLYSLNN